MAELRFRLSPTKTIPFKLIGDLTTIGRDPNNSIVIDHPSVSPFHAEILLVHSEDRYEVFDLGSPNGTKVNGEQVIRKELENGDQINFGKLKAEILLNSSPNTQNSDTAPVKKEKVPSVARASKKPPIPKLVKTPPTKGEDTKTKTQDKKHKFEVQTSRIENDSKIKSEQIPSDTHLQIERLENQLNESIKVIDDLKSINDKLKKEADKKLTSTQVKGDLKKFKKKLFYISKEKI